PSSASGGAGRLAYEAVMEGRSIARLAPAALALGLVPFAAAAIPAIQDETYYWTWSRALAARYFDHPPGVALAIAGTTALFGDGLGGLRLSALLSMLVTLVFV